MRYLSQTIVLTPWVMGFLSLYLLAFIPQTQEIYISVAEDRDFVHGVLGLVSLSVFSALLYYWNHKMVTRRIDGIYPDHADIYFDRGIGGIRNLKTIVSASLPFAGLCIGLVAARAQVQAAASHVKTVSGALGSGLDQAGPLQERLQTLPGALVVWLVIAIAVSIGVIFVLHRSRNNVCWQRKFMAACYAATVLLVLAPVFFSNTTLIAARLAGPLAGTGLVLIAGAVFLRFLFSVAAKIAWVLLTLPSLLILSMRRMPFALGQFTAFLVPLLAVAWIGATFVQTGTGQEGRRPASIFEELRERSKNSNLHRAKLAQTLASWLQARETGTGEYPVFIISAQGGGIYAASATSFFLAGMQERCPAFAEHVFAVSAVSGGSIGASLFDAALAEKAGGKDASRAGGAPTGCIEPAGPGELFERLRKITRDDHLSPVLAYILPDLVRDIRELFAGAPGPKEPCKNEARFEWFGRDQILEKSFIASFERSDKKDRGFTAVCPSAADANMLMRNFSQSWSPDGKLPALLLNATWVETGYRVAFSPFSLQHLGEGTLYSFDDVGTLSGERQEQGRIWQDPSLIGAAAVSARFPFVMPPWASNPNAKSRWTFVDGGYADASGSTTGLELYNELRKELNESPELKGLTDKNGKEIRPGQIKLYLISLTDAFAEPDYRSITGSSLDDFISPVSTILTVRELLARRAITRAYAQLGVELITVQLDQQTFPLPLGWKLSALSSDIVRLTMGKPGACDPARENDPNWAVWTVNHNSCQLKRITTLLADAAMPVAPPVASQPPAPATQASPPLSPPPANPSASWHPVAQ
ncbi:MAG: hypothetical protein ACLPIX_03220 [Rhodomicrobium sp.]